MSSKTPYDILKDIKKKNWDTKKKVKEVKGNDFKFLNTYSINDLLQEPKDWNAIAERVSKSSNHKFFGKDPEWILKEWRTKSKKGQERGMTLDTYIGAKLNRAPIFIDSMDEIEKAKAGHFDTTYEKWFSKLPKPCIIYAHNRDCKHKTYKQIDQVSFQKICAITIFLIRKHRTC